MIFGPGPKAGRSLRDNVRSREHIYPKHSQYPIRLRIASTHLSISERGAPENAVTACRGCNLRKGDMHPVAWLELCPEHGVKALAALLVQLGEDALAVHAALARRPRPEAGAAASPP